VLPINLDDNIVGHTVFFPYSLGWPFWCPTSSYIFQRGHPFGCYLPYVLSQEQIKAVPHTPTTQLRLHCNTVKQPTRYEKSAISATMKIPNFPEDLGGSIGTQNICDRYSLVGFGFKASSRKDQQSLETRLLLSILDKTKQRSAVARVMSGCLYTYRLTAQDPHVS